MNLSEPLSQILLVLLVLLLIFYLQLIQQIRNIAEWIKKVRWGERPPKLNEKGGGFLKLLTKFAYTSFNELDFCHPNCSCKANA